MLSALLLLSLFLPLSFGLEVRLQEEPVPVGYLLADELQHSLRLMEVQDEHAFSYLFDPCVLEGVQQLLVLLVAHLHCLYHPRVVHCLVAVLHQQVLVLEEGVLALAALPRWLLLFFNSLRTRLRLFGSNRLGAALWFGRLWAFRVFLGGLLVIEPRVFVFRAGHVVPVASPTH